MDSVLNQVETKRAWLSDQIFNASAHAISYGETVLVNAATPEALARITNASGLSSAAWVAIILASAFVCLACVLPALLCCTLKTALYRLCRCIVWALTCGYCCTKCKCFGEESETEQRRRRLGIPKGYPDDADSEEL